MVFFNPLRNGRTDESVTCELEAMAKWDDPLGSSDSRGFTKWDCLVFLQGVKKMTMGPWGYFGMYIQLLMSTTCRGMETPASYDMWLCA